MARRGPSPPEADGCEQLGLADPALRALAEIVHDVDVRDAKHEREEPPGVARVANGIAAAHARDEDRLARGASKRGSGR